MTSLSLGDTLPGAGLAQPTDPRTNAAYKVDALNALLLREMAAAPDVRGDSSLPAISALVMGSPRAEKQSQEV
jgi:hypothetical protein